MRFKQIFPLAPLFVLGKDTTDRSSAYRALLDEVLTNDLLADIRIHLQQQRALGHAAFRAMVEAKTHHFAGGRPAHRPRKPTRTTE